MFGIQHINVLGFLGKFSATFEFSLVSNASECCRTDWRCINALQIGLCLEICKLAKPFDYLKTQRQHTDSFSIVRGVSTTLAVQDDG